MSIGIEWLRNSIWVLVFQGLFLTMSIDAVRAQTDDGPIDKIVVEGTQRIETETITSYLTFKKGDVVDEKNLDDSLKALFATDLFTDVTLDRQGSVVTVRVVENPIVNRIAFEGNRRIGDETLQNEVQLKPRAIYTRSRVQNDAQRIIDIYRRSGRFAVRVEPKVIELSQNRVDLAFEIEEGSLTGVRKISFIGNRRFSDNTLRDIIQTKESAFWRFLSTTDSYDPDRLAFDQELLRRKYQEEGYADFRVVSAIAELAPDREAFFITFTVEEGERYRIGKVEVSSGLSDLEEEKLKRELTIEQGEWYDSAAIEETVENLTEAAARVGHAFVNVRPNLDRDRKNLDVDITFDIQAGPRVFIERIDIRGNLRTRDSVIRREFGIVEGDAFNIERIRRAQRGLRNLGYFSKVEITNIPGSSGDRTIIHVDVEEQSTGEISFGAGYSSSGGLVGSIRLTERNLVGRGQSLRLDLQIGQRRQEIEASFTEPYFLDRDLAAGFDVFNTSRDLQEESSFDRNTTGFRLRMGYFLSEDLSQRWYYSYRRDKVGDIAATASLAIRDQAGRSSVSAIGHGVSYDTRDSRFDPRTGMLITLDNELAGMGGSERFLNSEVSGTVYFPLSEDLVAGIGVDTGYVFGLGRDVRILDRFFLGGDDLRGFELSGIGPRDVRTGDAVGGKWFYRGSVGVSFPLGLPDEIGIRGRVFSDFGSLGGTEGRFPESDIRDTGTLRASAGFGIGWRSPLGPMNIDFAKAFLSEDFDRTQTFHFSFGTRL